MKLSFEVPTKIQKPRKEVFDAVHDPKKLSAYFTTGGASAALEEGRKVIWRFADYPGDIAVQVSKVVPNELIVLEWKAQDGDYLTRVEIRFEDAGTDGTQVTISEGEWKNTPEGLQASYSNCSG
jgi:uncharacterized protein YndB with AHSA1/START domain